MLSIYNEATLKAALASAIDPKARALLAARLKQNAKYNLTGLTHLLVVQPGDTEQDIIREVGFSPLTNVIDGARFGSDAFHPFWDWLQERDGWFELIVTVGNDGFAYVLLIQDVDGVLPALRTLCRTYS